MTRCAKHDLSNCDWCNPSTRIVTHLNTRWTPENDALLLEVGPAETARVLGVSCAAANDRLYELRHPGVNSARTQAYQDATASVAVRSRTEWTEWEEEFIFTEGLTVREIAFRLGRTYSAVINRRHQLTDGRF